MTSDLSSLETPSDASGRDDDAFLAAFFDCTLPPDAFRHRDHLRLTWLALRRWGADEGTARVLDGIRRYAAAQGASRKFDEPLTRRWAARVRDALREAPAGETFAAFLERQPRLLDKDSDAPGPPDA